MFQFSTFALLQPVFNWLGFPIRKSADQFIFANPRSLSQLIASFFASESQGIPRVPFLTFFLSAAFAQQIMLLLLSSPHSDSFCLGRPPLNSEPTTSVVFSSITSSNMSKNGGSDFQASRLLRLRKPYGFLLILVWRITDSNR